MLGGKNHDVSGSLNNGLYFIDKYQCISWDYIGPEEVNNCTIFTLDEFYEKYPYKVGDFVRIPEYESKVRIDEMKWDGFEIQYSVFSDETEWYSAKELNEYNSKPVMETTGFMQVGKTFAVIFNDANYEDEVELQLGDYEIEVRDGKTYAVKKKPVYPKTYEECCKIVNASPYVNLCYRISGGQTYSYDVDSLTIYENFRKLKICRDAYWKIAGRQMGLGSLWEPDWKDDIPQKYVIRIKKGEVFRTSTEYYNAILAFPTKEMRDVFYENFKDLIGQCKELL